MLFILSLNRIAVFAFWVSAALVAAIDISTPIFVGEATWSIQERYFESDGNIPREELNLLYDRFSYESEVREIVNLIYFSILFIGVFIISSTLGREWSFLTSLLATIILIFFHLSLRHFMGVNSLGIFDLHRYALLISMPILVSTFKTIKGQYNG